jgi:hypothetical protein
MASMWILSRELTCPQCGDVIGRATLRRFTGWLTITLPDGSVAGFSEGAVQLRVAQQRLNAAPEGDKERAQRQVDYVQRVAGEQVYDLRCPRGHHTMISSPHIILAMRRTGGDLARLG